MLEGVCNTADVAMSVGVQMFAHTSGQSTAAAAWRHRQVVRGWHGPCGSWQGQGGGREHPANPPRPQTLRQQGGPLHETGGWSTTEIPANSTDNTSCMHAIGLTHGLQEL